MRGSIDSIEKTNTEKAVTPVLDLAKKYQEGLTQAKIGERFGWSVQKISDYSKILNLSAQVLSLAKTHQAGRADKESAVVDFHFTEGWFRNSGRG